jgi:hypothetical protein
MKRLYTVIQSFNARFTDGEAREFKPGETLWYDLEQPGDLFKFEIDTGLEWFADRQKFEESCVLTRALSAKPS